MGLCVFFDCLEEERLKVREALLPAEGSKGVIIKTLHSLPLLSLQEVIINSLATAAPTQSRLEPSLGLRTCASRPYTLSEHIQSLNRGIPVDASVCDALAVLKPRWAHTRDGLLAFYEIGLDHDAEDVASVLVPRAKLLGDGLYDVNLIFVLLLAIPVGAVDHDTSWEIRAGEL